MSNLIPIERVKTAIREAVKNKTVDELEDVLKSLRAEDQEIYKVACGQILEECRQENIRLSAIIKENTEKRLKSIFEGMDQKVLNAVYAASQIYDLPLRSCVYFIQNVSTEQIKIGMAIDLEKRFHQIKTAFKHIGMPEKLKLIAVVMSYPKYLSKIEKEFHQLFKAQRAYGEWFSIKVEDVYESLQYTDSMEYIEDVLVNYMDYESFHLENIAKDYDVPIETINETREINSTIRFIKTGLFTKTNKLKLIEDSVSKHNVGFYETMFVVDGEEFKIHSQGIRPRDIDTWYCIQDIKTMALNRDYLSGMFKRINSM